MRILIAALGSAGDVHPFVGIGRELAERGHEVTLFAQERFAELAERCGLTMVRTLSEEQSLEVESNPDLWHPSRGVLMVLKDYVGRRMGKLVDEMRARVVPGDTLIVGSTLAFGARIAGESTGTPFALAHLAPQNLRSIEEPPLYPGLRVPAWWPRPLKAGVFWLADRIAEPALKAFYNEQRRRFDLGEVRGGLFTTELVSPHLTLGLFPEWFAERPADWPRDLVLTGFPRFDESRLQPLADDLEAWIGAGDPPLLFTPGSGNRHGHAFFAAALEATEGLGRRALFVTAESSSVPASLPSSVRVERYAPFGALFSRCAAVIHHGGIGTTAQALAAGVPQLVQAMAFDQPDNGARLARLGVGRWLTPRRFKGRRVARELDALLSSDQVLSRARDCAARLAAEDGCMNAAERIEALATS